MATYLKCRRRKQRTNPAVSRLLLPFAATQALKGHAEYCQCEHRKGAH